jgi:hypothetical protein
MLGKLTTVHFARLVLLEAAEDRGTTIPASLIFCSDFDGTVDDHIEQLAAEPGLDGNISDLRGIP